MDELNEALGYSGKDKIKVTYNAPSHEGDVDEQINILDEELDRYPIAVGIAVIDRRHVKCSSIWPWRIVSDRGV